jgi:ferredoxin
MSHRLDPSLLSEISEYGTVDIEACFNCGNCTAICPLAKDANFPRRIIRMAQLGMREALLASKELWLCYYCGDCSSTCPRQAEPGEFMAAARRYAIARYDPSGLAKLFFKSPAFATVLLALLAVLIGLFMVTMGDPSVAGAQTMSGSLTAPSSATLFQFLPRDLIHTVGLAAGGFVFLVALLGIGRMIQAHRRLVSPGRKTTWKTWIGALWNTLVVEMLGQKRYREDCESGTPWYFQKWFAHASTMWGFLGLLAATASDFTLDILGIKPTGTPVPLWYPVRLLGTITGVLLVYGTSVAIVKRLSKKDRSARYSWVSDWAFIILMWLSGITGFTLEIAIYLPQLPAWAYWIFLCHVVVAGEMLVLLPFTKFAHAVYRTLALYIHALDTAPQETQEASAASVS